MKSLLSVLLGAFLCPALLADEGMWPMSEIGRLDLKSKGLKIPIEAVYNPAGVSLVDGICNIGGCTGSFVSPEGLILTNHHCAFGAIQQVSTPEHNYLKNGFLARSRDQEAPAKGLTVRITESYRDVSARVLSAVQPDMDPAARTQAIERRINEIVLEVETKNPGKRAEVAEMFIGKTYVLFVYTYLKDVRLVYAPPESIGEYGGDIDNWNWPRHTGDFSFFRAYVTPEGSPGEYSPSNVPYRPRRHIKISPSGAAAGDFIFILGYPGRTYRHRTAGFLDYEYRVRLPFIVDWYGWQIKQLEAASEEDTTAALKLAPRIKSLSNIFKNNRGKLIGIRRTELLDKKSQEEKALAEFIAADPDRRNKYSEVLNQINQIHAEMAANAPRELLLQFLTRSPEAVRIAFTLVEAAHQRQMPEVERESAYMDRNWTQTRTRLLLSLRDFHKTVDRKILGELLKRAAKLPSEQKIAALDSILEPDNSVAGINRFLNHAYDATRIHDEKFVEALLSKNPGQLMADTEDPFLLLAAKLYPEVQALKETQKRRDGDLNRLYALYLDARKEFLGRDFIPDANGTLRLTYGHVKGYSPRDAVFMKPITTLMGVVEKHTGEYPFDAPEALIDLHRKKDFGPFAPPDIGDVPVGILYDADTTGGNSGSPIFNANGELIGVNFDRVWEATINDYAWSSSYSRSIGVDNRYVLWVALKLDRATSLLEELGLP